MNRYNSLYRASRLPLFQNLMFQTAEDARNCETGDIHLVQDLETGLVFNQAFEPERLVYDENYQNEQANSESFRRHLDNVVEMIKRHLFGKDLIEVGCGKGGFLSQLDSAGFKITGMDPAYEGDDPAIRKEYFTPASKATAGGIILRHVLEHIHDPFSFLERIRDANAGQGLIYIEVPCLDWIIANRSWFDVFYEHVNYFRISDFQRMFGNVLEATHSFDGQYLSIVADLSSLRKPVLDEERLNFPEDFGVSLDSNMCKGDQPADFSSGAVVWGGASKGVIFSIQMMKAGVEVSAVVDINPAKQGKYLAVSGLRVISPEEIMERVQDGTNIIVMNPNYLEEIKKITDYKYNYTTAEQMINDPIKSFEVETDQRIAQQGENTELVDAGLAFTRLSTEPKYSYNFSWLGRPIIQYPQDIVAMQELIFRIQPTLIIETGIAHGGSLIFSASMLELNAACGGPADAKVVGIDIDIRKHNRDAIEAHPMAKRIEMLEGSSLDEQMIAKVAERASGEQRVLVCLDSNHTHAHALAELEAYAPLVTPGSYCVVFDTVIEDLPAEMFPDRPWGPGDNPKTSVYEYLKSHPEFEIDESIDNKLLISVAPKGYLKRLK